MDLTAQYVIAVTGASRGIGRATALAMASRGVRVAALARSASDLRDLDREMRQAGAADTLIMAADLRTPATPDLWITSILEKWGRIDALVNNAGVNVKKSVDELTDEDWATVIETNLTAPFRAIRRVIAPMREQGGGHIVNVASIAAEVGFAGGGAYCASKFGLRGMADALTHEVRRDGIKVTTLEPGSVDTRFDSAAPGRDTSWKIPPAEIARAIVHLLQAPDHVLVSKLEIRPTLQGRS